MQGADVPVRLIIAVDGGEFSMFPWVFEYVVRRENKKNTKKTPKTPESHENRNSKFASQMLRPLCLGDCRRCSSKVFVTKLSTRNHPKKSKEMLQ